MPSNNPPARASALVLAGLDASDAVDLVGVWADGSVGEIDIKTEVWRQGVDVEVRRSGVTVTPAPGSVKELYKAVIIALAAMREISVGLIIVVSSMHEIILHSILG